jgi:hypothetical protein
MVKVSPLPYGRRNRAGTVPALSAEAAEGRHGHWTHCCDEPLVTDVGAVLQAPAEQRVKCCSSSTTQLATTTSAAARHRPEHGADHQPQPADRAG